MLSTTSTTTAAAAAANPVAATTAVTTNNNNEQSVLTVDDMFTAVHNTHLVRNSFLTTYNQCYIKQTYLFFWMF